MDPNYIKKLSAAYEEWLTNLSDQGEMKVLKIDVSELDFISRPEDVSAVAGQIKSALIQTADPQDLADAEPLPNAHELLPRTGALASYQNFHNFLDKEKEFDPDLFYNYILLVEEMGEFQCRRA